jgi:RNA methyltransferase, TrmH family
MITSTQNPRVKWIRSLQADSRTRREEGLFVIEGVRLSEEALAAGWQARLVLAASDLGERAQAVVAGFAAQGAEVEIAVEHVLRAASATETPQGLLVVLEWRTIPLPSALDFVLIPDLVRDPGNLGTMLRTAAAAGVQAVFIPPETADPFSPKVLRAGMGAHFHMPIWVTGWDEIDSRIKELQVYLASANAGSPCFQTDLRLPLALIVGGEAEGAGPQARHLAGSSVYIPMPGGSESLNAAVAAGILIFEVVRQRGSY